MNLQHEVPGNRIPRGMRIGRRELNSASLTLSLPASIPEEMRSRTREISNLFVPPEDRRRRIATALLNLVCQEADANRITLILTARPYDPDDEENEDTGGPDEAALVRWYQRFGFQVLLQIPAGTVMARQVQLPAAVIVGSAICRALRESRRG